MLCIHQSAVLETTRILEPFVHPVLGSHRDEVGRRLAACLIPDHWLIASTQPITSMSPVTQSMTW